MGIRLGRKRKYLRWEGGKIEITGVENKRGNVLSLGEAVGFIVIRCTQQLLPVQSTHEGYPDASPTTQRCINQRTFLTVAIDLLRAHYSLMGRHKENKYFISVGRSQSFFASRSWMHAQWSPRNVSGFNQISLNSRFIVASDSVCNKAEAKSSNLLKSWTFKFYKHIPCWSLF